MLGINCKDVILTIIVYTECGVDYITMLLGDALNISSPNYPMYYFDNQWCIWYFTKTRKGTFVVEILDMLLQPIKYYLYVDIYDIGLGTDHTESDSMLLSTDHVLPTVLRS